MPSLPSVVKQDRSAIIEVALGKLDDWPAANELGCELNGNGNGNGNAASSSFRADRSFRSPKFSAVKTFLAVAIIRHLRQ